jgi:hypothetical protein
MTILSLTLGFKNIILYLDLKDNKIFMPLKNSHKGKQPETGLDLTLLFGSLTRVKLMALMLQDYNKSYFVRELTRLLNLQINAIRRELDNLTTLNILKIDEGAKKHKDLKELFSGKPLIAEKSVSSTEKKYYKINEDCIFLDDLKNLFLKAKVFAKNNVFNNLEDYSEGIVFAVLLGKFVNDPEGSIDLLVVGEVPAKKMERLVKDLEKQIGEEINYALMKEEEFNYRQQIVDKFLYKILENNKIVLIDKRNNKLFNGNSSELIA